MRALLGGLYYGEPREWNATDPAINALRYSRPELNVYRAPSISHGSAGRNPVDKERARDIAVVARGGTTSRRNTGSRGTHRGRVRNETGVRAVIRCC